MGSYESAVWGDAMAMACDLAENFTQQHGVTLNQIRKHYESVKLDALIDLDDQLKPCIADYLAKTASQRPALERKVTKNATQLQASVFRVLCILGACRAYRLLELRDRYRMVLAPGLGNRVTASGAYQFCMDASDLINYRWPYEVFEAAGIYAYDDEDA
jgi:hypothetical protein